MSTPYLISKAIDPIFALSVGVTAAVVRINREEKGKGKSTQDILDDLKRRTALVFGANQEAKVAGEKAG